MLCFAHCPCGSGKVLTDTVGVVWIWPPLELALDDAGVSSCFEECARPGLEPRVCAARAAHPTSVGRGFLFSPPIKSHQCDLLGDLVMVAALAKKPYRLFALMKLARNLRH